jgi:hypothetical protein
MSLKPDTVDRGMDLPRFKDQVSPVAAGRRPHDADDRLGSDPPQFKHQLDRILAEEEVPMAEATPVTAATYSSPPITPSCIEERLLRLEAQQQQQQGRPPTPSTTTTGSAAT